MKRLMIALAAVLTFNLAFAVEATGNDIAGEDFYRALLKRGLGNKPVQDDLKQALLGKAS